MQSSSARAHCIRRGAIFVHMRVHEHARMHTHGHAHMHAHGHAHIHAHEHVHA